MRRATNSGRATSLLNGRVEQTPMQSNLLSPRRLFLLMLITCGVVLVIALALKPYWTSWLYPNVAAEARRFLREKNVRPLSEDLQAILTSSAQGSLPTQVHPLLGRTAPDFTLKDDRGEATTLRRCLESGPVVLVFYYGYHCNHCVGQLFAVNDDLAKFRELDATVIATSADPVEETQTRYAEYGRFGFTVLSDPGNQVAAQYGVFKPPVAPAARRKRFRCSRDLWRPRNCSSVRVRPTRRPLCSSATAFGTVALCLAGPTNRCVASR